jgi:hypothetical protein
MQTFLPYPDFGKSAVILDRARLGKQRIEVFQILEALAGIETRWKHHPAVVMWKGSEFMLGQYGYAICDEWIGRGYQDSMRARIEELLVEGMRANVFRPGVNDGQPWWLGADGFHLSHQSNLIRKDPTYYRRFWPNVPDNLEYVWPADRAPITPKKRSTT